MKRQALRARGGAATFALVRAETIVWGRSADGWLVTLLAAATAALSCAWLGKLPVDLGRLYPFAVGAAGALAAMVASMRTIPREGTLAATWLAAPLFGRELARAKVLAAAIRALPVVLAAYGAALFELRPTAGEAAGLLFVGLAVAAICIPLALVWDLRVPPAWSPLAAVVCALVAALLGAAANLAAPLAVPASVGVTAVLLYAALRQLGEQLAAFELSPSLTRRP